MIWTSASWRRRMHGLSNTRTCMSCLRRTPNCLSLCYEKLASPQTYRELSRFLETSPFKYQSHIGNVKDASNKADPTALLIRQRIDSLQPQIAAATRDVRAAFG